jgi:CheY-like chemotaxis protein
MLILDGVMPEMDGLETIAYVALSVVVLAASQKDQ